jgi:CRP-like cAMP-binding protein
VDDDVLTNLARDEHEVVRETAICLLLRAKNLESRDDTGLVTFERMLALRAVPLFAGLAPQELASLARAALERAFAPGAALCTEGDPGVEVFILLSGEVTILRRSGGVEVQVGREAAGGFIGEMAVLDPAPRAASVLAGDAGTRVLCLGGEIFREVLRANPSVAEGVIRALAARVRGSQTRPQAATPPR